MHLTRFHQALIALAVALAGCGGDDTHDHDGGHTDHDGGHAGHDAGRADEDAGGEQDAGEADAGGGQDAGVKQDDAGVEQDAGGERVEITFEARVGSEAFACDATYTGVGSTDAEIEPRDFRLYVHDVRLLQSGGGEQPLTLEEDDFQHAGVALLDFEDNSASCTNGNSATNTTVAGTAPAGDYEGIAFTVGVPVELNHADPAAAASPLNLGSLHWSWAGGYKFTRIDFMVTSAGTDAGTGTPFNFHLGSTACEGDPSAEEDVECANANHPMVELMSFDAARDKVIVDYAALVADDDMNEEQGGAPGCMSGPDDGECEALFPKLGLDLASGEASSTQSVFSVEAK